MSYIVGDDTAGVVAVIDPRRDVDVYVEKARVKAVRIAAVIETHIHADFVSGTQNSPPERERKFAAGNQAILAEKIAASTRCADLFLFSDVSIDVNGKK